MKAIGIHGKFQVYYKFGSVRDIVISQLKPPIFIDFYTNIVFHIFQKEKQLFLFNIN